MIFSRREVLSCFLMMTRHDSCDSLYDSLVTAYLVEGGQGHLARAQVAVRVLLLDLDFEGHGLLPPPAAQAAGVVQAVVEEHAVHYHLHHHHYN